MRKKKFVCALLVAMFIVFSAITGAMAWEVYRIDPTLPTGMIPWAIPGDVSGSFYPAGYHSGFMTTYHAPPVPVPTENCGIIGYWIFQYNLWDSYRYGYRNPETFQEMDEGDRAIFQPGATGKLYD
jgi:hypothetical protein